MPFVKVDKERCKGCALCPAVCPKKVLEMSREINSKGYFFAFPARPQDCIGCKFCAMMCPDVAIEVWQDKV